jgi:ligand-binding SRPBCC domain-containing protein
MNIRIFEDEFLVDVSIDQVFDFFSKAENLEKITPPFLKFKIMTKKPINLKQGTIIDYKLNLRKVPFKWKTKITAWDPPYKFEDTQVKGPYKQWIHTHTFKQTEIGTMIKDRIEYRSPGWIFEPIINKLFVRPDIEKIFKYRREQFQRYFNSAS